MPSSGAANGRVGCLAAGTDRATIGRHRTALGTVSSSGRWKSVMAPISATLPRRSRNRVAPQRLVPFTSIDPPALEQRPTPTRKRVAARPPLPAGRGNHRWVEDGLRGQRKAGSRSWADLLKCPYDLTPASPPPR